jgi:hypothetical protein
LLNHDYYAPEQRFDNPQNVDARADIYALGCILYELFFGNPPVRRDTPRLGSVDPAYAALDPVIDRMTRYEPASRYPHIDAATVDAALALGWVAATMQGARPPASKGPKEMARLLRSRNGAARAEGVNVAIQLGPEAVADLHELVGHSRRDVRNAAALALGSITDERSIPYLVAALHSEHKPDSKNFWDFRPSVDEAANALSAYSCEARQVVLRDLDRPILWDQFLLLVRGVESDAAFATAEDMHSRGLLLLNGFNERGMLELLVRIDESKAWPRVRRLIGGGSKVSALPDLLPLLSGEHQIEIVSEWLSSGDKSDKYGWHIIIRATMAIPAGVANLRPLLEALSDGMVAYPEDSDEGDDYREKVSARLCELDEA